jgi:hypothetical protein
MITERAGVMRNSILVVVKCKSQKSERKANEQEIEKFSIHWDTNLPTMQREVNRV